MNTPHKETHDVVIHFAGATLKMRCYQEDKISSALENIRCFYELPVLCAIKCRNMSGAYVDVGANIGNHSVFFSRFCKSTRIIAVEPCQQNAQIMSHNIQTLTKKPFTLWMAALGEECGAVSLDCPDKNNMGHIVTKPGGDVLLRTLDYLMDKHAVDDKIAVLKIDVEGDELKVLRGSKKTIDAHKPLIVTECWREDDLNGVAHFLNQFGYKQQEHFGPTPTYLWSV